jgi:hypothetical protein
LSEFGVAQNLIYKVQSIMSQRYYGDITIVPNISHSDFLKILSNPTPESIREATLKGERATWPSILFHLKKIVLQFNDIIPDLSLTAYQKFLLLKTIVKLN